MKPLAALLLTVSAATAQDVPSGQPLTLQEVLVEELGEDSWVRFRFVAPDLTRDADYDAKADDMIHLCDTLALPYIAEYALESDVIVISFAQKETEFGVADPDTVQIFEAFRAPDGACIWEGF